MVKALETLLNEDDDGRNSLEIVRILAKTIKSRSYMIDESVLNILLSLDVLQDFDPNTKDEDFTKVKVKKKDRAHLSKKQRKVRKEMKKVEEEMQKAEQTVLAEEREIPARLIQSRKDPLRHCPNLRQWFLQRIHQMVTLLLRLKQPL